MFFNDNFCTPHSSVAPIISLILFQRKKWVSVKVKNGCYRGYGPVSRGCVHKGDDDNKALLKPSEGKDCLVYNPGTREYQKKDCEAGNLCAICAYKAKSKF